MQKVIGNLELNRQVGSGTVGTVYIAQQHERSVAIKVIDSKLAELSVFQQKLMDNRQPLQQLRHQLIASVQQVEKTADSLYAVSDWVNGENLDKVRAKEQLTLAQIGRIVEQIAQGLSYAHRQGVVHGGLHPRNVLLVNGRVDPPQIKLTDFLLTSLLPGDPPANLLPYLAPEQVTDHRINARSDVYSLGVILYQLVTGRLPFLPKSLAEAAVASGEPISPQTLRSDVSSEFASMILKTVARPIRHRYRSMEEFLTALRPLLEQLPDRSPDLTAIPSRPIPAPPATRSAVGETVIRISHPDIPDQQYPVGDDWLITIGSMPGNDLTLPGEGVSDKHARLEKHEDGSWKVVDMGSRRGTFLESSRLLPDVPEEWDEDQTLRIGPYLLAWGTASEQQSDLPAYAPPEPPPAPKPVPQTLQMHLQPQSLHTSAGQPANAVVEIENDTAETAVVTLTTGGIPDNWVTLETGALTIPSRQKVQVPLVVQPPRHHTATAGDHTLDVIATPQDSSAYPVTVSGNLTIRPFNQSVVAVTPPTMRHGQRGTVQVTNTGNETDNAKVAVIDVDEMLGVEIPEDNTPIHPGETASISMTVMAKKERAWVWTTTLTPFEVQVQTSQNTSTLPAQVIVPPRIPTFLLGLVALLLIAGASYFGAQNFCRENGSLLSKFGAGPWVSLCNRLPTVGGGGDVSPTATAVADGTPTPTAPPATPTVPATPIPTEQVVVGLEESIGTSVNGNDITAVSFGSGPDAVILVGGIDGDFAPGAIDLPKAIINHYQNNPEAVAAIPDNITLYIIPNLNPDALNSQARLNANGVRLNSNWPCRWQVGNDAGRAPLSAPENQALNDLIEKQTTVVAAIIWTFPRAADNQKVVSPGLCDNETVSDRLSETYAAAAGYQDKQADPGKQYGGDVTNSLSDQGIPAVFVLLDDDTDFDLDTHLAAITAVLSMDR